MANPQRILSFLPWLRTFEAAARRLNFSDAAQELGLSQAAVSQQIKLLEQEFGEKLFDRRRRGVTITPAGAAFLPHVQSAFRSLTKSSAELFGENVHQRIVLRSPISFTSLWLGPKLSSLAHDLPGITLDIKSVHHPDDYNTRSENLDIRFGSGHFAGRKSIRLTQEILLPVAAPRLLDQMGPSQTWEQLPLLSVVGAREMWSEWFEEANMQLPAPPTHRFDTFITALSATYAGAGVLLGSRPLIDDMLNDEELIALSDVQFVSENGHFLTCDADTPLAPAETSLLNWFKLQADTD